MSLIQQKKYELIIEEAKHLFLNHRIESVTISDVAKHLGMGEATLYRYFGKKHHLVVEVAIALWRDVEEKLAELSNKSTGLTYIHQFFQLFHTVFKEEPAWYLFVADFDLKLIEEPLTTSEKERYEQVLGDIKTHFDRAISTWINPNSVCDLNIYYYTTTHAIIGLCKKLAAYPPLLTYETEMIAEQQIELLIEMSIKYLEKHYHEEEK